MKLGLAGVLPEIDEPHIVCWKTDNASITDFTIEPADCDWGRRCREDTTVTSTSFKVAHLSSGVQSLLRIFDPRFRALENAAINTEVQLTIANGVLSSGRLFIKAATGWIGEYAFDIESCNEAGVPQASSLTHSGILITHDPEEGDQIIVDDWQPPEKIESLGKKISAYYLYLVELMRLSEILKAEFWDEFVNTSHNLPPGDIFGNNMYFEGVSDGLVHLTIPKASLSSSCQNQILSSGCIIEIPVGECLSHDDNFCVEFIKQGSLNSHNLKFSDVIEVSRKHPLLKFIPEDADFEDILNFWYPLLSEINDRLHAVMFVDKAVDIGVVKEIVQENRSSKRCDMPCALRVMKKIKRIDKGGLQARVEDGVYTYRALSGDPSISIPEEIVTLCDVLKGVVK